MKSIIKKKKKNQLPLTLHKGDVRPFSDVIIMPDAI